jgi:hypothetical protein
MAKPIFIVTCPPMNREEFDRVTIDLRKQLDDYHVILVYEGFSHEFGFQVLNCPELNETKLDELQKIVLDSIYKKENNG